MTSLIHELGADIVGIASLTGLADMPAGLNINIQDLIDRYPFAVVFGTQHGKLGKKASGDDCAVYLERIAYGVTAYLEKRRFKYLVVHPEDEFDPVNRMGLFSLKVLAKQSGIGWQGRSLLVVSPEYGPVHRFIAILTNMPLEANKPMANMCGDCSICIDKCPTDALRLQHFEDHPDSREQILKLEVCRGDDGCSVCILVCPYLKK